MSKQYSDLESPDSEVENKDGYTNKDGHFVVFRESEKQPMFRDFNNPNKDIFIIPTQEGSDNEDQWNGSIGDATLEHVYNMRHRAPEMDFYYLTNDGNLFRFEANVTDRDSQKARQQKIIDAMTLPTGKQRAHDITSWKATGEKKRREVTEQDKENLLAFMMEEAEEMQKEKEDALDQTLIPFDSWQDMPQMTKHIDIPSTPAPMPIYAGNCSQMFYDAFPEDHPDKKLINQLLMMLNGIDWDDFGTDQVNYFVNWIGVPETKEGSAKRATEFIHLYAAARLQTMIEELEAESNTIPDNIIEKALRDIEENWAQMVYAVALKKSKESSVTKAIDDFEKTIGEKFNKGQLVWRDIGAFGKTLSGRKQEMTSYHWTRYFGLKMKFCPRVIVSGNGKTCDVNRDNLWTMTKVIGEEKAKWCFFNRPIFSVEDLVKQGTLNLDNLGYTNKNVAIVSMFKKAAKDAVKQNNLRTLTGLAQKVIDMQKQKTVDMSEDEWILVWQAYRVCKNYVMQGLKR